MDESVVQSDHATEPYDDRRVRPERARRDRLFGADGTALAWLVDGFDLDPGQRRQRGRRHDRAALSCVTLLNLIA